MFYIANIFMVNIRESSVCLHDYEISGRREIIKITIQVSERKFLRLSVKVKLLDGQRN
jgi:hypothetical protein